MGTGEVAFLGIIQGLTEFLPISSSAHLVFAQEWMHIDEATALPLDVFLHLGTLLAAVLLFRVELWRMTRAVLSLVGVGPRVAPELRLLALVLVATIPAVVIGLVLKDVMAAAFTSATEAARELIVTGVILLSTRFAARGARAIDMPRAIGIGVAQAFAILPGISRSGATIATAIWSGVDREDAARFSFLMSVPIIFGAALVEVPDMMQTPSMPPAHDLAIGFLTSFVAGVWAIRFLLRMVGRGRFEWFGIYCVVVGAVMWRVFAR